MKLGNGLWERTLFSLDRLQPTEIGLSASPTNFTDTTTYLKWKVNYSYVTTANGGKDNNGNIRSQMLTAPGLALTQTYTYDKLNRLTDAQEKKGTVKQWEQTFSYDRFGNRRIVAGTTTASLRGPNPAISTANNQITTQGYDYDDAGNLTQTPITSTTYHLYGYDAEDRLVSYDSNMATYSYDADGRRVKTQVGSGATSVTTIFVYNAFGQLVAEYNNASQSVAGGYQYLTQDHLGSTRVVTRADKSIKARYDYLPFGEEVGAGVGGRTEGQGYNGLDNIRQKFVGKERDAETGLDYFINRYYASTQGRFTSADPIPMTSMRPSDPQQLNLYAYVRNNPLRYNDPYGLDLYATGSEAERFRKDLQKESGLKLKLDPKTGKISIDGKAPKNLSEQGKQIAKIIGDTNNTVRVEATRGRDDVVVGKFEGNGKQVIDYADIDQLGKAGKGGLDAGASVVHEVTEAYAGVTNTDPTKNFKNSFHPTGIYYENLVRQSKGLGARNERGQVDNTFGNETFVTVDFTTHYEYYTLVRTGQATYQIKDVKVEKKK